MSTRGALHGLVNCAGIVHGEKVIGKEGAHSLAESFDTTDSWLGTERALLLTIALAQ